MITVKGMCRVCGQTAGPSEWLCEAHLIEWATSPERQRYAAFRRGLTTSVGGKRVADRVLQTCMQDFAGRAFKERLGEAKATHCEHHVALDQPCERCKRQVTPSFVVTEKDGVPTVRPRTLDEGLCRHDNLQPCAKCASEELSDG